MGVSYLASTAAHRAGSLSLVDLAELVDANGTIGEDRTDFQLAAHRLDHTTERADVHVGSVFDLRYGGLLHLQGIRELLLREPPRFAQLIQRHVLNHPSRLRLGATTRRGRPLVEARLDALSRCYPLC